MSVARKHRYGREAAFSRDRRRQNRAVKRWIQQVRIKRGALHRQLGIPAGERIPLRTLRWAAKQPGKLGRRARLAINFRSIRLRRRRSST